MALPDLMGDQLFVLEPRHLQPKDYSFRIINCRKDAETSTRGIRMYRSPLGDQLIPLAMVIGHGTNSTVIEPCPSPQSMPKENCTCQLTRQGILSRCEAVKGEPCDQ